MSPERWWDLKTKPFPETNGSLFRGHSLIFGRGGTVPYVWLFYAVGIPLHRPNILLLALLVFAPAPYLFLSQWHFGESRFSFLEKYDGRNNKTQAIKRVEPGVAEHCLFWILAWDFAHRHSFVGLKRKIYRPVFPMLIQGPIHFSKPCAVFPFMDRLPFMDRIWIGISHNYVPTLWNPLRCPAQEKTWRKFWTTKSIKSQTCSWWSFLLNVTSRFFPGFSYKILRLWLSESLEKWS